MNVRGGCGDEVEGSSAWLSATANHGCRESAPFARDRVVDGEGIECCLDHPETLRATCALIVVSGDEDAEVEFGERGGADCPFDVARTFCADENGGIEEGAQLLGVDVGDFPGKTR